MSESSDAPKPQKIVLFGEDMVCLMLTDNSVNMLTTVAGQMRYLDREQYAAELDIINVQVAALRSKIEAEGQMRLEESKKPPPTIIVPN